jgi:hypothetical protein
MATEARPSVREAAAKLADHGIEAAEAYGRTDLVPRLRELKDHASGPSVRVLVAGEFKQGKSNLVNALVGRAICPVDDDVATSVPTGVRYAPEIEAAAILAGDDGRPVRRPIDPEALPEWVTEAGSAERDRVQLVDVGLPADLLGQGLVLVDLPGAGGLGSLHGAATLAALPHADGVIFVSDAGQALTAAELDFLASVARRCPALALVESKVDIHPAWRRILDEDRDHVAALTPAVLGVSADLARKGQESADDELLAESGVHELGAWLREGVLTGAGSRLAARIADEVVEACRHLRVPLEAEQATLDDPARQAEVRARLEAARAESERLRAAASRWQQVLTDAFADVSSDADHDLRLRVRSLVRRNEEAIDGFDPATAWAEYEPALRREVATLVADHHAAVQDRAADAARRVTEVFTEDATAAEAMLHAALAARTDPDAPELADPDEADAVRRLGLGGQAFTLARATYGPALMLGFLGGVAGITVAAPALLAVGLVAGGKGLRSEKERRLAARQAQAKAAVRKFVDEVIFELNKESRDQVRQAQRLLRNHFAGRADELVRSATTALEAAQRAAAAADAGARRADVAAELERIAWLEDLAVRVRTAVEPPS